MIIQQSNVLNISDFAEWSSRSQEAIIDDSQHGAEFFSSKIQDVHTQRLQHMLSMPSPAPSMAEPIPKLSKQDSEVFVVFEKTGFFASLKANLAKLFCLASPN